MDHASNVRGGAAVLADLAGGRKPSELGGWYDSVSNYGDGALCAEQVYEGLQGGASATIVTSEGAGSYYHAIPEGRERQRA